MTTKLQPDRALMFFVAQTMVHAGGDATDGVIDRPIQREAHTDWPVVFSSGVKGALRDAFGATTDPERGKKIRVVLGPKAGDVGDRRGVPDLEADEQALPAHEDDSPGELGGFSGALAIGNLEILLLPVRSLTSHFKLVTCRAVLQRYRDARLRLGWKTTPPLPPVLPEHTSAWAATALGHQVFLEERLVTPAFDERTAAWAAHLTRRTGLKDSLQRDLVVVHDDVFRWLSVAATHKATRVHLTDVKGVDNMWMEEAMVPSTVLHATFVALPSRDVGYPMRPAEVLAFLTGAFKDAPYLRVGGNETLGQGWGKVTFESR